MGDDQSNPGPRSVQNRDPGDETAFDAAIAHMVRVGHEIPRSISSQERQRALLDRYKATRAKADIGSVHYETTVPLGCDVDGYPIYRSQPDDDLEGRAAARMAQGIQRNPLMEHLASLPSSDPLAELRDAYDESEPDPRDADITQLKAEVVKAQRQASFWKAVNSLSIHCLNTALGRLKELRGNYLSASWHHLPCITAGLADPRVDHPVVAAIRRGWKA